MALALAGAAATASAIWALSGVLEALRHRRSIRVYHQRLAEAGWPTPAGEEVDHGALATLVRLGRGFAGLPGLEALSRVAAARSAPGLEPLLEAAGLAGRLGARDLVAAQLALATLLPALWTVTAGGMDPVGLSITLFLAALGYRAPMALLGSAAEARRRALLGELPVATDLLVLAIEAGLSVDRAVEHYTDRFGGPLAQELGRALGEMRLGLPRAEALRGLARRSGAEALNRWVGAILRAERHGTPLGQVLRSQSREVKTQLRQRMTEEARQAPVKMLLPILLFILPALMVVLLGPLVLRLFVQGSLVGAAP